MVKEANRQAVRGEESLDDGDDFGIVTNGPNRQELSWRVRIIRNRRGLSRLGISIANGNRNHLDRRQWELESSRSSLMGIGIVEIVANGNCRNHWDCREWESSKSSRLLQMGIVKNGIITNGFGVGIVANGVANGISVGVFGFLKAFGRHSFTEITQKL